MATQSQIDETYNYMDAFFRAAYGEYADCSGAMYNGDFALTLLQAQRAKHNYIIAQLGIQSGSRVLDIGCGWGPFLNALRHHGANGIGLTLSTKQAEACRRNGLQAHIVDWKHMDLSKFGKFDAIVSVGAFEHFCSKEEYVEGKQAEIYARFFKVCHELLRPGGRLYLQTMTWGKHAPIVGKISMMADKTSNEYIVALTEKFYPGSWLPSGEIQVVECAAPYFERVYSNSGRNDYLETIKQWNQWRLTPSTAFAMLCTFRYLFTDRHFTFKLRSLARGCQYECFKREIMDHRRIVFWRIDRRPTK